MQGKFLKKVDYKDCKIVAFEVKKRAIFCKLLNKVNRL
jgi:hypothetical protein